MLGDVPATAADEYSEVHPLPLLGEEPECDDFVWMGSLEDLQERIMRFRGEVKNAGDNVNPA